MKIQGDHSYLKNNGHVFMLVAYAAHKNPQEWQDISYKLHTRLVWFGLVYGISILVGYLMPNPVYTYILNIYDL